MSSSSLQPMSPSRPSARQPFRSEATPPRQPFRLGTPSPLRFPSELPQTFPESPTSQRRRSSASKPLKSLAPAHTPRWRLPHLLRSPRKALWSVFLVSVIVALVRVLAGARALPGGLRVAGLTVGWYRPSEDERLCRFVSPVEAYHRDLARLSALWREQHPEESLGRADHLHAQSQHHHGAGHYYSPTGHLVLSNESSSTPHPIPQLLTLGETRWEDLLSRQSRTLPEAVREYTRRYGRPPPKGFDDWWDFAMLHELVLPDEYDRINLDLAPFFALPGEERRRRMAMVEEMKETFTIVVEDGQVHIQILDEGGLKWDGTWPRAQQAAGLIKSFARFLPNMKATFSIFDQPQIYLSWGRRGSLVDLGLRGEHTTHLHETDNAHVRLSRSCPPDSHFRNQTDFYEGRSFIYDQLEATDLCHNPYVVPLHGLTIEPHGHDSHPRPHTQLLPLFSLAKTSINSDILVTPLDQFYDKPGPDPKWEDKSSGKLAWRGSPTGISMMTSDLPWRQSHRIRLHQFANNRSSSPLAYIAPDMSSGTATGWRESEVDTDKGMDFWFDMKLAGQPLQCEEWDGTCEDMRREIDWAPFQRAEELNKHKFLLDVDGNGWSGRFRRLMSTNSVVVKATLFTEWFQPHLIPWFMYIPAKLDYSDLPDIMAFFRGTPEHPDKGFDETAKALARNGQCFVHRMFRLEDLQAYMMRLFLEYARLAADDGEDMDFYLEDDLPEVDEEMAEGGDPIQEDSAVAQIDFSADVSVDPGYEGDGESMANDDESAQGGELESSWADDEAFTTGNADQIAWDVPEGDGGSVQELDDIWA